VLAALVTDEAWTPTSSDNRAYAPFGAGLSAMNFMNQATEEGLIAHPMAGFEPLVAKQALGIPSNHTCMLLIAIGYKGSDAQLKEHHQASERAPRTRLPLERVMAWNTWTDSLESEQS
jgi:nitroreductase